MPSYVLNLNLAMTKTKKYLLGFDLGGTKMLCAVLDRKFRVRSEAKLKVGGGLTGKTLLRDMGKTMQQALQAAGITSRDIACVGVAVPGIVEPATGVLLRAPNLGLENFPLRQHLQALLRVPVLVENDVNAGIYGEYRLGAGRGYKHIVGLYLGTGIGGGLVLDGHLYRGATGGAGELGHMIIQADGPRCGCGQHGCFEALCSRTALSGELAALAAFGQAPLIFAEAGTDFRKIRSSLIRRSVLAGEKRVIAVLERSARYLGIALANTAAIFNPELVVLGGGMIEKLGRSYLRLAVKSMHRHAMPQLVRHVQVALAELGDHSVTKGAAALALETRHPAR